MVVTEEGLHKMYEDGREADPTRVGVLDVDSPERAARITDGAGGFGHTARVVALRARLFQGTGERACPACPRDN